MFLIYADGELLYSPMDPTRVVFSPKLTLEMGKAGALNFVMPTTNHLYGRIRKMKSLVTVELSGVEIFRGRMLSEETDMQGLKSVYCEGDLAYLVDSVQKNDAFKGSMHALFRRIVARHNAMLEPEKRFTVGTITVEDRPVLISGQSDEIENAETGKKNYKQIIVNATSEEWSKTIDYLTSTLIDMCGGYLRTRRVGDITYLDYFADDYGVTSAQGIAYGVNLLTFQEEETTEELFTVLIPLGDENLTIESVNGGRNELVSDLEKTYGRIVRTFVFEGVTDPVTLLENGRRYLLENATLPTTITATGVDLHMTDPGIEAIHVGDRVPFTAKAGGAPIYKACAKIEYDLENPANTVYTFGVEKQTLTQRYMRNKKKSSSGGGGKPPGDLDDDIKAEKTEFFDSWIDHNPEDGTVSIGATYRKMQKMIDVLSNQVGIDLDAKTGNVDIRSVRTSVDDVTGRVRTQSARIEEYHTETQAAVQITAALSEKVTEELFAYEAKLEVLATTMGTEINAVADKISLKADATVIDARLLQIESDTVDIKANLTKIRKLLADEIEAVKSDISWMTGKTLKLQYALYAPAIYATGSMYVGLDPVATKKFVYEQIAPFVTDDTLAVAVNGTKAWVTENNAWGEAADGARWLRVGGGNVRLSLATHKHDELYAPLGHTHAYAADKHEHAALYAAKVHNHDTKYTLQTNTKWGSRISASRQSLGIQGSYKVVALGSHRHYVTVNGVEWKTGPAID